MCSTPRPKLKIKGKATTSGSILSNITPESRKRFAERANAAQVRRNKINLKKNLKKQHIEVPLGKSNSAKCHTSKIPQKGLSYWLLSASLKDIFRWLFFSSTKRT